MTAAALWLLLFFSPTAGVVEPHWGHHPPQGGVLSVADLYAHITPRWPAHEWDTAYRIARCESRGNPRATKIDHIENSYGLFQINRDYWAQLGTPSQLLDPAHNAWAAHQIWQAHGWRPWSCAR